MGALCGIIGKQNPDVVKAMARALAGRATLSHLENGADYSVASDQPIGKPAALLDGVPRLSCATAVSTKNLATLCREAGGPESLPLREAFAGVVHVNKQQGWWFFRDRLGRKPLYYFRGPDCVLFASELKGLLASGLVPKRLNLRAVDHFLTMRCVPGPETAIHGVFRVPPGHTVTWRNGQIEVHRFAAFVSGSRDVPKEEAAAEVREILRKCVEQSSIQTALWSGGVDCAAIAAVGQEVRPLFVALERAWQDEARLARESARQMGLPLHVEPARQLTEESFLQAVRALDEPISDMGVFPLWLVFEAAAKHATSFLSGHGADPLLGGYPRYHYLHRAREGAHAFIPTGLVTSILPSLPPNAFVRRYSRYLASIHDNLEAYLSLVAVFDRQEREDLYTSAMKAALEDQNDFVALAREHFADRSLTRNMLSLDLNIGLPNLLLTKCDRLASAHGISLCYPYLCDDMLDYVSSLASEVRFGVRSKPLLRMAMRNVLPGVLRFRARRDFHFPESGRLVHVIESVARQCMTPERVDALGIFKWHHVERVMQSWSHNVYRRRQFLALLMFFAWYAQVMEK